MLDNKEIWKDCKGYEGLYQVSNIGRVWNVKEQRYLKGGLKQNGYCRVTLRCRNGKQKTENIHRLVALAFLPNPDNLPCVNHKDENKQNNHIDNLEWCSYAYNNSYGTRTARAAETKKYKITVYDKEDNVVGYYDGSVAAAQALGVSKTTISNWANGRTKSKDGYRIVIANGTNPT